jgi:hypothetical protein
MEAVCLHILLSPQIRAILPEQVAPVPRFETTFITDSKDTAKGVLLFMCPKAVLCPA